MYFSSWNWAQNSCRPMAVPSYPANLNFLLLHNTCFHCYCLVAFFIFSSLPLLDAVKSCSADIRPESPNIFSLPVFLRREFPALWVHLSLSGPLGTMLFCVATHMNWAQIANSFCCSSSLSIFFLLSTDLIVNCFDSLFVVICMYAKYWRVKKQSFPDFSRSTSNQWLTNFVFVICPASTQLYFFTIDILPLIKLEYRIRLNTLQKCQ